MIFLPRPAALHGEQLEAELAAAGLPCAVALVGDQVRLTLDDADLDAAAAIVAAHVPPPPPEPVPTPAERIAVVEDKVLPPTEPAARSNYDAVQQGITDAIDGLTALVNSPALPAVPTVTLANVTAVVTALRNEAQATRAGAQHIAATLRETIRLVRGDFDDE